MLAYKAGQPAVLPTAEDLVLLQPGCDPNGSSGCGLPSVMVVYVTLAQGPDGLHHAAAVAAHPPDRDAAVLQGILQARTLTRSRPAEGGQPDCAYDLCISGSIEYDIERWYGPQGKPADLDHLDGGWVRIRARVAPGDTASLDALVVDGRDVARPPRL